MRYGSFQSIHIVIPRRVHSTCGATHYYPHIVPQTSPTSKFRRCTIAFTPYTNTGSFSNNASPGISATFLNSVETFLDQIDSPAVIDANVTADGSGNWTAVTAQAVLKSKGGAHTLTGWNFNVATANNSGTTVTHGIKNAAGVATAPTAIFCTMDNFALSEVCMADSVTSTTFRLSTSGTTTRTIWWLALLA